MPSLRKVGATFLLIVATCLLASGPAQADRMRFSFGADGARCNEASCAKWVLARGVITAQTPAEFLAFINRTEMNARTVRFDSPGGDLVAGMRLGEVIRAKRFDTEATYCASACAYAFLGGEERRLVGKAPRFGVHRFYRSRSLNSPTLKHYSGEELDRTQRLMAGLMLYVMKMGADMRLITLAAEAGPGEMRWIDLDEARSLSVTYTPYTWEKWEIKAVNRGIIAVSQTHDGSASMQIACTRTEGAYFLIRDTRDKATWFRQCQATRRGGHPILGAMVGDQDVITRVNGDQATIAFFINPRQSTFANASVFTDTEFYGPACIAPSGRYEGSTEGLKESAALALKNCVE